MLLDAYDALLVDLDGTVYRGTRVVEGATATLGHARAVGRSVRFVTNNASKAPAEVAQRLQDIGIPAEETEVATSAQAAAATIATQLPQGETVLIVGTDSLADEMRDVGLRTTRTFTDEVVAVAQGHSPATCWSDLAQACLAIRAQVLWVACNTDATVPAELGELPGNGAMVAALQAATDRHPRVAGKPAADLFTRAATDAGADQPLVVGDRLDTDIAGAYAAGLDSMLVLSGVTTPADLLAAGDGRRPTYLGADITALYEDGANLAVGERASWEIEVGHSTLRVRSQGACADPLELLRALCISAWRWGITTVEPLDERSKALARTLSLGDCR